MIKFENHKRLDVTISAYAYKLLFENIPKGHKSKWITQKIIDDFENRDKWLKRKIVELGITQKEFRSRNYDLEIDTSSLKEDKVKLDIKKKKPKHILKDTRSDPDVKDYK